MIHSNKSKSSSKNFSELRESKTSHLQKDLESLIVNLESEKRESTYLDEQIKQIQLELSALPKSKKNSALRASVSVQEKKLELEINQLNNMKFNNKLLREKINDYRLEKSAHKQSLNQIISSLGKASKEVEEQHEQNLETGQKDSEQKEKIVLLRSRSASQRSRYSEKISSLASCLRNTAEKSKFYLDEKNFAGQGAEITAGLKGILKKFARITFEKKNDLEGYLRFLNRLQVGFEEIQKATGLSDVKDIVTSCIKSEEQNSAVLFYLNNLNSEIDLLSDSLQRTKDKIKIIEESKMQGVLKIQDYLDRDKEKSENIKRKILSKTEENQVVQEKVQKALPVILMILKVLEKPEFSVKAENFEFEIIEKLNFENTRSCLGLIEELASFLVMSQMKKSKPKLVHKKVSSKKMRLKEIIEDADLLDEAEFDDIKVPISLEELKNRAEEIVKKRKRFVRGKSTNPDTRGSYLKG